MYYISADAESKADTGRIRLLGFVKFAKVHEKLLLILWWNATARVSKDHLKLDDFVLFLYRFRILMWFAWKIQAAVNQLIASCLFIHLFFFNLDIL